MVSIKLGVIWMNCQVNHCHAYVQREKAEMGFDFTFAKTPCYEPEEIADVLDSLCVSGS